MTDHRPRDVRELRSSLFVMSLVLQAQSERLDVLGRLEARARGLEGRVRIAASHFQSMAEGFSKAREPSKAAACQGMADLMEDRL